MVKEIKMLLVFCFFVSYSFSQSLSFSFDFGTSLFSNYNTTFESKPYEFLYAAPFAYNPELEDKPIYDQIRLVQLNGIKNQGSLELGFSAQLFFKNNLQLSLKTNYAYHSKLIYYTFQNTLVNLDKNEDILTFGNKLDPSLLDNSIQITNWKNGYGLKLDYFIPIKSRLKPYISANYTFQFVLSSIYNSNLLDRKADYTKTKYNVVTEIDEVFLINEYLNARVFQDRIFEEFKNDEFNHLIGFGSGIQYYNTQIGLEYNFTLANQNIYYKNSSQLLLYIKFQFATINLLNDKI